MVKKIGLWIAVIALVGVIAAVIIYELDRFNVIDLDYVPKYLEVEDLGSAKELDGQTAFVSVFLSFLSFYISYYSGGFPVQAMPFTPQFVSL